MFSTPYWNDFFFASNLWGRYWVSNFQSEKEGFRPFDLLAVGYHLYPELYQCNLMQAYVSNRNNGSTKHLIVIPIENSFFGGGILDTSFIYVRYCFTVSNISFKTRFLFTIMPT